MFQRNGVILIQSLKIPSKKGSCSKEPRIEKNYSKEPRIEKKYSKKKQVYI